MSKRITIADYNAALIGQALKQSPPKMPDSFLGDKNTGGTRRHALTCQKCGRERMSELPLSITSEEWSQRHNCPRFGK